ncbi:MAG: hypothetical protein JWM12_197 [Ilumatobacteraceae bacterium]|nr:hypothetical protein [Ilumatobacteraceae bacterium]
MDGTPHVHAQLFIGQQSDVALPLGFADTVTIGFEDIDHSAGAPTPPPVAVMAVGTGNAGSAYLAFLTLTRHYCIAPWTHDGEPFQIRVSQQDPYTGLTCDGAAGSIHYTIVNAEQQPDSRWKVTSEALQHDFTTAILTSLPDRVVADSPRISEEYGDVVGCSHPPLFS